MRSGSLGHGSDNVTTLMDSKYCPDCKAQVHRKMWTQKKIANVSGKYKKRILTSLTVFLSPAALAEVAVDSGGLAGGLSHRRPRAHVSALPVVFVGHDVVVLHRVEDLRPVQSGEVAQVWVLLDSYGSSGDVHQAMEADLSQLEHLEYHQSVVEEEVAASDHGEVGEKVAEALQPVNPK